MIAAAMGWLAMLAAFGLWGLGGWWISGAAFDLRKSEQALAGFSLGLILDTWLLNVLAQIIPIQAAVWLAPGIVFATGLGLGRPWQRDHPSARPGAAEAIMFVVLTYVFTAIGRGLAIFDEFQNLPITSGLAMGDVPPHFSLNPALHFGYHYLSLLFAAQLAQLGQLPVWTSLDFSRAVTFALLILLAAKWAYRLTHNRIAGLLSGIMMALAGGARWIFLILPASLNAWVAHSVSLSGANAGIADSFSSALTQPMQIQGAGPLPFPFAYMSGIDDPNIIGALDGRGPMALLIVALLLFANPGTKGKIGYGLQALLLASLALADEIFYTLILVSLAITICVWMRRTRSLRLPPAQAMFGIAVLASGLIALFQGGVFTEVARGLLARDVPGGSSFFDLGFHLTFPPAVVSGHLGILSLLNPAQLLAALLEIGPVILVLPLVLVWWWRRAGRGDWLEAAIAGTALVNLLTIFVLYEGTGGTRNSQRFLEGMIFSCKLYAVPLVWSWARRRSAQLKTLAVSAGLITVYSGFMILGIELIAAQRPVLSYFITPMDAAIYRQYWNKLEPGTMVFDPQPYRAATVFARPNDSSLSWYDLQPEWQALVDHPDPLQLAAAGYGYMYFDKDYWKAHHDLLGSACIQLVQEVEGSRTVRGQSLSDFRRLVNIQGCK